jgi:Arc/MetJ family transcription regulator
VTVVDRLLAAFGRRRRGFASPAASRYTIHMKRTNLVLDEDLLEEATRLSGEKTYSAAVQKALRELVRRARARQILELRGSGLWQGDLAEMRADRPGSKRRARRR